MSRDTDARHKQRRSSAAGQGTGVDTDGPQVPDKPQSAAQNRGKRAPREGSGEVIGSGAGAGGGGSPEDYDDDPAGGGGMPRTKF